MRKEPIKWSEALLLALLMSFIIHAIITFTSMLQALIFALILSAVVPVLTLFIKAIDFEFRKRRK